MAINYKKIWNGVTVVPKTASSSDLLGELETLSSDSKLYFHNGTSNSPVVTEAHSANLTNKTLTSPVINTGVSGTAIDTDGTLAANSDTLLASQKAVKTYVDTSSGAVQSDVNDLITLSGVPANSTDLGTFTGTTIPDASTVKSALQALETGLEAHIADTVDAHDASAISNVPAGTIAATDVQAAINELDGDIQGHITDAVDAHDASAISSVPSGNLAATDVQGALNELQSDIDTRVAGPASATDEAVARFDGTTGKLVQNSVVTITDTGIAAGLTGLTSSGTVSSTGTLAIGGDLTEAITTDNAATGANATITNPATSFLRLTNASLSSIDMISSPVAGEVITIENATGVDITINNDLGGTAANRILTGTKANLTLKDEASIIVKYDSTESRWMVIGGTGAGSGSGINYILSSDGGSTTGWATYADAAQATPVDGTGGSPNVTFATTTSSPLVGTSSFLFTKDAANRQGQGVSYAFTIDSGYQAQILRISFPYSASANYVDTVSGNLISSDMQVFVYDVTNSVLIPVIEQNIGATSQGQYVGSFQTASNSTSYRLILHIASTNATAYTLKLDNVVVGPQTLIKGPIVTDWQSYTPTFTGFGTPSGIEVRYRRVGSNIEIAGQFTTGTPDGTTATFTLPSGLSVASPMTNGQAVGNYFRREVVTSHGGALLSSAADTTIGFSDPGVFGNSSVNAGVRVAGNLVASSSTVVVIRAAIPVTGYSSNIILSEDSGNRLIAMSANTNAGTSLTALTTNIPFTVTQFDYTASWNGSQFTAPETGVYDFFGGIRITTGTAIGIYSYINGTINKLHNTPVTAEIHHFAGEVLLTKGQVFSVRSDTNVTLQSSSSASIHHISISKRSTPQTLAGSETVAARYTTNAGQAVTSGNIVVYEDLVFDTHNAMNTSTGRYTVPVSGKYTVTWNIGTNAVSATVGQLLLADLHVNAVDTVAGRVDTCENTNSRGYNSGGSTTVSLNKSDIIDIRMSETLPAVNLAASAIECWISIVREG